MRTSSITFECFSCNKLLKVGADKAGKKSKCPNCGTILTVPVSSNEEEEVEVVAGFPPRPGRPEDDYDDDRPSKHRRYEEDADDPATRPAGRGSAGPAITFWSIFLLAGAVLLVVNAFLPWWKIHIRLRTPEEVAGMALVDKKVLVQNAKIADGIIRDNMDWYADHLSRRDHTRMKSVGKRDEFGGEPEFKFSKTLLGINTAGGVLGLIFAFVILVPVIVGIFVAIVRRWLWISAFISAIFGLVVLIFAIMWLVDAPGESAGDLLRQGIIVGPWLELPSALVVLAAGIVDGIFGVRRFVRELRPSKPAY